MANEPLRYMAARDVDNGAQTFGMVVRSTDGAPLGRLEGFMIDPNSQTLRYYVVDVRKGRRLMRKMVPFVPAWLDAAGKCLHLLVETPGVNPVPASVI